MRGEVCRGEETEDKGVGRRGRWKKEGVEGSDCRNGLLSGAHSSPDYHVTLGRIEYCLVDGGENRSNLRYICP